MITPIEQKRECRYGTKCKEMHDSKHQRQFYHPCPNGNICNRDDDPYHASNFFHPGRTNTKVRHGNMNKRVNRDHSSPSSTNNRFDSSPPYTRQNFGSTGGKYHSPSVRPVGNFPTVQSNHEQYPETKRNRETDSNPQKQNSGKIGITRKNWDKWNNKPQEPTMTNFSDSRSGGMRSGRGRRGGGRGGRSGRSHHNSSSRTSGKFHSFIPQNNGNVPRGVSSKGLRKYVPLLCHTRKSFWASKVNGASRRITDFNKLVSFMKNFGGRRGKYENLEIAIRRYGKPKFYRKLLPKMLNALESTPQVISERDLPFLPQGRTGIVVLDRRQCLVILVNAFFSTFLFYKDIKVKGQKNMRKNKLALPTINFKKLFNLPSAKCIIEKIKCFLHYFEEMLFRRSHQMNQNVFFIRMCVGYDEHLFRNCQKTLIDTVIRRHGRIEQTKDARQVDFANMYLGGGTLARGNVQEEIRFCINPECVVGMVLNPCLFDTEVVIIRGTEQFSEYKGYGSSFEWAGPYRGGLGGQSYEISAMDALNFSGRSCRKSFQYEKKVIMRELWKSYVGFKDYEGGTLSGPSGFRKIATGHWGCGAFKGNKGLKFVLQWISASINGKELEYYCYEDRNARHVETWFNKFKRFVKMVLHEDYTISQMYEAVLSIGGYVGHGDEDKVLEIIMERLRSNNLNLNK